MHCHVVRFEGRAPCLTTISLVWCLGLNTWGVECCAHVQKGIKQLRGEMDLRMNTCVFTRVGFGQQMATEASNRWIFTPTPKNVGFGDFGTNGGHAWATFGWFVWISGYPTNFIVEKDQQSWTSYRKTTRRARRITTKEEHEAKQKEEQEE